ncbi:lon protease [bacterium BMS3Bbin12]|nr:lon protease [bacterium BMS3Abin12]GBE47359.1 lon protease [bacterium BMS3Bbin12]GBE50335.1 lon protease [bacterium BMS3Bbin13]HDK02488.1 peptidase S16 [Gammaproteobacteria bacterium]
MSQLQVPLFPLQTVLFPEGALPLRVFEARYLDMVSDCLKRGASFGVCLIRNGREAGEAAATHEVGTLARIADWHVGGDGLLNITAHGTDRFHIVSVAVRRDRLAVADVELLEEEPQRPVPGRCRSLVDLLRRMFPASESLYEGLPRRFGDARWVGWRLAELLPLRLPQKQYFLQITDPIQRLERLVDLVDGLDPR